MGIFNFVKKQLLSVIEWNDSSSNVIVYRYPLTDRDEIMNSSTLVVRESQVALFMHKGEIADVFGPGTYKLSTENIPFLTKILSLPTGFNSRIKAEVYFVNTKQFINQKWGTQNPIMLRDADFGNVRLRGYGAYSFKINDARVFMKEIFGTNPMYKVEDCAEYFKPMLLQCITDAIAECKISALDLATKYNELSSAVKTQANEEFSKIGVQIINVVIENISLPAEVEKMLDERTKMGVIGDKMGTFTQYQAAQSMREAANNPNGNNLAGLGMGLGAGAHIGSLFNQTIATAKDEPKKVITTCPTCGKEVNPDAKFCANCGATLKVNCPKCGEVVKNGSKFCSVCGNKLEDSTTKKCPTCGSALSKDAKFCTNCGEQV